MMRQKITKNQLTIIILFLGIGAVLGVKYYFDTIKAIPATELARVKGSEQAPIKVMEFIDFQCPACAKGALLLKEYMLKYPDKIRLEMKYFPLKMHYHAYLAAQFAECAARQDKFWPLHDLIIERQQQWSKLLSARVAFEGMAQENGIDLVKLGKCLQDESINEVIEQHKSVGETLGVKSTPTYFINEKMVVGTQSLQAELDQLLNAAEN